MNPPTNPTASTMEAFFTRQRANEGIEVPLFLPDGTPTEHSLRVRGVDSDNFRQADAAARRGLLASAVDGDGAKLASAAVEARLDTLAALVVSWTFEKECTPANVKEFLREAPQIAEQIDRLAAKRSLFFKLGSPNSAPSPAPSSS